MFSERVLCARVEHLRENGDVYEDVETGKAYHKNRLFLEANGFHYFLPHNATRVTPDSVYKEAVGSYSFATEFITQAATATAKNAVNLAPPVMRTPFASADLDRVINVCQDMGQWAWAYNVVLEVLGLKSLSAQDIVFDGAAHVGGLGVWSNGRTLWLAGAARQVIEYWFAVHGGWHGRHARFAQDREEYERACLSVASPWTLANVPRSFDGLNLEWAPADLKRAIAPLEHDFVSEDGVLYRTTSDGRVLPHGYALRDNGQRPEKTLWDATSRLKLIERMNVPLYLRSEILHGKED
jgi:hypothetical protein